MNIVALKESITSFNIKNLVDSFQANLDGQAAVRCEC